MKRITRASRRTSNRNAWDGSWYVSYIGKDGRPFGSKENEEGQIYLYTQAWAVIAGIRPARPRGPAPCGQFRKCSIPNMASR